MCLAIPGRIVQLLEDEPHYAVVDVSGVRRKINVDLLRQEGLQPDDWVLIHVGFAMSKISEEQARDQLRLLAMLGEAEEALQEVRGYAFGGTGGPAPGAAGQGAGAS
ncbi:MAG TPA: HypC/HybG/HupF family hydrogenase formation chaperone [Thermaerobacter sp.]|uniref:HypC/HybG/HupF family hydrogenase formation chaperone n=1 Tax=Thermaerobacter sp. PB12/4term TaxID=2293838 RepID=UPI000E326E35|nr:HypC/HybG/HupF family hydrogenase formation chaperone [Thermaerobacter sp. PB12/4term]QIA27583.1 HypC/HybG/HupF family hydrogenase formation chaperone [Thermaerobacter sp. PB12/4term]